jgi:hypothetical protein
MERVFLTPQHEQACVNRFERLGTKIGGRGAFAWPDFRPQSELQEDRLRAVFFVANVGKSHVLLTFP